MPSIQNSYVMDNFYLNGQGDHLRIHENEDSQSPVSPIDSKFSYQTVSLISNINWARHVGFTTKKAPAKIPQVLDITSAEGQNRTADTGIFRPNFGKFENNVISSS
jgi:hypothetical protein